MARIAGVDLPRDKRIEVALTYIYGIGVSKSRQTLKAANVNPDTRVKDLTEREINKLRGLIDRGNKVEGDLEEMWLLILNGLLKSVVTEVCAIGVDYRLEGKEPEPMLEHAKGP